MSDTIGKTKWLIPDGFWHSHSNGLFPSHESICTLNTSSTDAVLTITLFFEDREEIGGFTANCPARRTHHIRMDKLVSSDGKTVPKDIPYAILVQSNVPVVIQYSRMDTSQSEMAMMTTIAFSEA
jgi:hypothetical protein